MSASVCITHQFAERKDRQLSNQCSDLCTSHPSGNQLFDQHRLLGTVRVNIAIAHCTTRVLVSALHYPVSVIALPQTTTTTKLHQCYPNIQVFTRSTHNSNSFEPCIHWTHLLPCARTSCGCGPQCLPLYCPPLALRMSGVR